MAGLLPGTSDHNCKAVSIYGSDGKPSLDTRDPKVDNTLKTMASRPTVSIRAATGGMCIGFEMKN